MNFGHLGKTVQILLSQVQQYVYDYNMGKMTPNHQTTGDPLQQNNDSCKNHEWNFPGLRKNVASSSNMANMEAEMRTVDQDGIKELLMLQQRTVLQVHLIVTVF
jgi:hypothetical protein